MTYEIFLMRVLHRTGLNDRVLAQELTHHVVTRLAQCIPQSQAEEIAEHLPDPLGNHFQNNADLQDCDLDTLYHGIAERLSVDVSFGLEFTQVTCQVFGETVGPAGRQLLRDCLPEEWHPLFEPRKTVVSKPLRHRNDRRTLSSATSGSTRPLSEAYPGHRNSIAHTDKPHLGTKLSTSFGKPERRTLAAGRPGSSRPISDG